MWLYRFASIGWAVRRWPDDGLRAVHSQPLADPPESWAIGPSVPEAEVGAMLAPIRPGKIVGIGRNYVEHAAELDNPMPDEPLVFLKATSSVVGPGEAIVLPPESVRVDLEGELAVVIGRRLSRPDPETARAGILGYTCACDVTARDLQRRDKTFARGKSFDTFCPLGPAIRVGEPGDDEVRTRVDGVEVQRGRFRDMAWSPVELVTYVARHMTLEPGDLLLTGTPAGVRALAPGQTVEVEIPSVGVLRNPVVAWPQ